MAPTYQKWPRNASHPVSKKQRKASVRWMVLWFNNRAKLPALTKLFPYFPSGDGSPLLNGGPQIKGKSTGPQSGWILPPLTFPCLLLNFLPSLQKHVFKNPHIISGSSFLSFLPQIQLLLQMSAVFIWALERSPLSYCTATKESPATDVPRKLLCK